MELSKEIEKSFPKIEKLFSKTILLEFASTPKKDMNKYNFGLGTIIRLRLLRTKSNLYKKFIQHGFTDKDKMTMEILKEFHNHLRHSNNQ